MPPRAARSPGSPPLPRRLRLTCLVVVALAPGLAPAAARAQAAPDRFAFVVRQGGDTLSIEHGVRTADSLDVRMLDLRGGGGRVAIGAHVAADARVERLAIAAWPPLTRADGPPRQRVVARFSGDSLFAETRDTSATVRRDSIAGMAGAIPYFNVVVALLEQIVRRARVIAPAASAAAPPVHLPVLVIAGGGRAVDVSVATVGGDSVVVALAGTAIHLRIDAAGRVLGGTVPARGIVIERVDASVAAAIADPAAREEASHRAPPEAPYSATEVRVRASDGTVLAGTLTLPARTRAASRVPAVVLVSGSSAHDRDYTAPRGYRLFWWLADTLSRRGVAVLRLDNRGVGGSGGEHDSTATPRRADDVRDAIAWLRARPDVDAARVGLVGISEGGLIAPLVASTDPRLRAMVLMAGPARSGRAIAAYQLGFRVARDTTVPAASRDSAVRATLARTDSSGRAGPWLRWYLGYDPLPTARRVRRTAVLVLHGSSDRSVPAADAAALATAFRAAGNPDVTVRVFPDLDHIFVRDPAGDVAAYASFPSMRVPDEVLGLVADWTAARLAR